LQVGSIFGCRLISYTDVGDISSQRGYITMGKHIGDTRTMR